MSMNKPLRIVSMLPGALATICVAAQTPQVITFNDAVNIALERNADLLQAQVDAALTDVSVGEARMQFVPDLKVDATGARNYGRNFNQTEGRVIEQTTNSAILGTSSGVTLFNGFRDLSTLRQAKFARTAGRLDLKRAEQTVVFTVATDFLALMQSQEQLRVQRENLAAEANLERQIKQYVEAGAREVAVLYQQEANVAAARLAVVQAQSVAESEQVDLMRTLQLDPAGTYDFQFPTAAAESSAPSPELAELLQRALAQRADLQAEEKRLAAAEQGLRIAHAGFWPTLSLRAGYGSAYSSASESSFQDQLNLQRGGAVSVGLSIPLFDRGEAHNASRRAHLETRSARIALDTARTEVGLQVRQAHQEYRSAREQFSAAEAQKHAAERAVQTAEERFKAGVTTLVEVSQARNRYVQADSAVVVARANLLLQHTSMEYHLGTFSREKFAVE